MPKTQTGLIAMIQSQPPPQTGTLGAAMKAAADAKKGEK